ncbi:hypothetical protein AB0K51_11790 [Kitasatospora sp. NPDC049285]|uniref:hypothetical protein n=1 Tax=Kitasatospora sp. NPDC049285 TaxID=3157096 RepID=UPI00341DE788
MSRLDADRLLAALDPLPYRERNTLLARAVREASPAEVDALIEELAGRGWFELRLAVFAAVVAARTDRLAGWLTHPDREVRGRAIRAVRDLPVPDEAVVAAYRDGSMEVRAGLRNAVVLGRRTALAERLLPQVREHWGAAEAAALLPACSPAVIAAELPGLAHAVNSWYRLATWHPDLVLDHAERELAGWPTEDRSGWWQQHDDSVLEALPLRPARVLELLERFGPRYFSSRLAASFGHLARLDVERATAWLAHPDRAPRHWSPLPSRAALRLLARAEPAALPALGRRWLAEPHRLAALLRALPPSRRSAFLDLARGELPLTEAQLTDQVLKLLPRERRWAEVRRLREEALAQGREERELRHLTALLPPADARPELLAATRRPDADERAAAWRHLVAVAAADADPAATSGLLAELRRVRNERDPVRQAALTALATGFPAYRLTDEHSEPLRQLATEALAARDLSAASRSALGTLALAVLRAHPTGERPALLGWALETVEQLTARTGALALGSLEGKLRRGQQKQVLDALRPWLDREDRHGRHALLFALVRALGRRAELLPELGERLLGVLRTGRDEEFTTALDLWLEPRRGRGERILTAIEIEPSAVVLWRVRRHLGRVRTDLLDLLLADAPPYGRFLRRGELRPLPEAYDADRWLPRQVERLAGFLAAIAADPERSGTERASAIGRAALLPHHGRRLVRRHLDDGDTLLAEAALGALPWTDDPAAALPELLAHAGDDRARVAVHAAGRAARFAPPDRLVAVLHELATRTEGVKVTSRKEAVRLAARFLPPAQAAELLAAAFHAPGQHPDVRAAAAAWTSGLLDAEPVWALLAEAADAPEPQVRRAVLGVTPFRLESRHHARYAALVAAVATRPSADPDQAAARAAIAILPTWAGYVPAAADPLPELVADLDDRGRWRQAAEALRRLAVSGQAHPVGGAAPGSLFGRAVAMLLTADGQAEPGPSALRDLPARQRIESLAGIERDPSHRSALLALADQLAGHQELLAVRTTLLVRVTDPAGPDFAADLDRLAAALDGRPVLAGRMAERLGMAIAGGELPPAAAIAPVRALAERGALVPGLLAVSAAARLGPRHDWSGGWRELLGVLRVHPEPEVRAAAYEVLTVRE